MAAYADCLGATSTSHAPWYVVPADDKRNARLIVSQIITDALAKLDMSYPTLDADQARKLGSMREALAG